MEIPSLPTDNLYKFMALSGTILVIVMSYLMISTGIKNRNDRITLELEKNLSLNDTVLRNTSKENFENISRIVRLHINRKYFKPGLSYGHIDSLLDLDGIYNMALDYPELMPAYEKLENLYTESKKQYYEFNTKIIRTLNLVHTLEVKDAQFLFLIVLLVFF